MTFERRPILCFGEMLLRLSSAPGVRLSATPSLSVVVGGAEANVASMLAQLGRRTEMVTRLPDSPLGELALAELRLAGAGTGSIARGEGRIGLYFFEPGSGARPGRVTYDRARSLFVEAADDFDWPALARGAGWLHLSGINLALGERRAEEAASAVAAMRAEDVPISFDVNHRASLWEGRLSEGLERMRELVGSADLLFASPRDLSALLDRDLGGSSPHERRAAAEAAFERFGKLSLIASTRRSAAAGGGHALSARVDSRHGASETNAAPLGTVIDRIGAGDAFAGAVIDSVLRAAALDETARLGLAAAVMKHGIAGDRWIGSRSELESFDPGAAADVQR